MKRLIALLMLLCIVLSGCSLPAQPTEPAESTQPSATVIPFNPSLAQDKLKVHFIDVGQADCILLECDNVFALVDAGYAESGPDVVEYLQDLGVQRLNLVVGTHPHGDHIGGLADVLEAFPVDNVWSGPITFYNSTVYSFLNGAKAQGLTIGYPKVGDTFRLGDATITVLGPVRKDYEDANDLSLVLMVQFGDTKFLLTGDMERIAETDLVNSGADLKADVLKVGHHGSYSSTSYLFLRQVAPTYGVISCGRNNEYGHPHDAPMSRLRDADVTIYRTDQMYTVIAISDGTDITFSWGNTEAAPWIPNAA